MKKIYKFIILFLFLFLIDVDYPKALNIDGFKCYYTVSNNNESFKSNVLIEVTDFNVNDKTGTVKTSHKENEDDSYKTASEYNISVENLKYNITLFKVDKNAEKYIKSFSGKCPKLYKNSNPSTDSDKKTLIKLIVDTDMDPDLLSMTLKADKMEVKIGGSYISEEEFRSRTQMVDDVICSYNIKKYNYSSSKLYITKRFDLLSENFVYVLDMNSKTLTVTDSSINNSFDGIMIHQNTINNMFVGSSCTNGTSLNFCYDNSKVTHLAYNISDLTPVCDTIETLSPTYTEETEKPQEISTDEMTCGQLLGDIGANAIKGIILVIQVIGAIIVVVQATLILIPAVKDGSSLQGSSKKLVVLAIVLVLVLLFKPLISVLGKALDFDISCII